MKVIPTYCNDNYSSDEKLLKRKSFHKHFIKEEFVETFFAPPETDIEKINATA